MPSHAQPTIAVNPGGRAPGCDTGSVSGGATDPIASLAFRHSWRPSQQRVLEEVQLHLLDRRLHVVAAPGAGKTTLGLECFRLLGKPAVVLSPTRTIRNGAPKCCSGRL